MSDFKVFAYYLPQFHIITENELWWGQGFTEWTCLDEVKLTESRKYSVRHPAGIYGQYNLLSSEVLSHQARQAKEAGIDGFFVWKYWFGNGVVLLEKPMDKVLSKGINFNYSFMWANHSWVNKKSNKILQLQKYLGLYDYKNFFYHCLPHFKSNSYNKVDGKPIFGIFEPSSIPDLELFIRVFTEEACLNRLAGIYWVAENTDVSSNIAIYFDKIINTQEIFNARRKNIPEYLKEQLIKRLNCDFIGPIKYNYEDLSSFYKKYSKISTCDKNVPTVISGWNTIPRHKKRGTIYSGFDVESYNRMLLSAISIIERQKEPGKMLVIKSWNEWAEGNVLEEDSIFGGRILNSTKHILAGFRSRN